METKKVKDLIIPLTDYPHMPYWGTLREAIAQLNVAFETGTTRSWFLTRLTSSWACSWRRIF